MRIFEFADFLASQVLNALCADKDVPAHILLETFRPRYFIFFFRMHIFRSVFAKLQANRHFCEGHVELL
jgi:hypothetical protein